MIEKDFDALNKAIKTLDDALSFIAELYIGILKRDTKNYTVTFKRKVFDFHPSTTLEEEKEMDAQRHALFRLVMKHCIAKVVKTLPLPRFLTDEQKEERRDCWKCMRLFAYGMNPADIKTEKIDLKDLYEINDAVYGKSRPLNMGSTLVQWQFLKKDKVNGIDDTTQEGNERAV